MFQKEESIRLQAALAIVLALFAAGFGHEALFVPHQAFGVVWDVGFVVAVILLIACVVHLIWERASRALLASRPPTKIVLGGHEVAPAGHASSLV